MARLSSLVQPPQRCFRINSLANTVDIEGVIPGMFGKRSITQGAQAVDIVASFSGVKQQAGVLVRVERTEIQPAPPGRPCSVEPAQLLDVVSLVVASNVDVCAIPSPGWPGVRLDWRRQVGQADTGVLAVALMQFGERTGGILVDADVSSANYQITKAPCVHMPREWQPRDRVSGAGLDLPPWLADRRDQLRTLRLEPSRIYKRIEGQPDASALLLLGQTRPLAVLPKGPQLPL